MKECPYCFWEIVDKAKKCKHCWEWVIETNNPFREEKKKAKKTKIEKEVEYNEIDDDVEDEIDDDVEDEIDDDVEDEIDDDVEDEIDDVESKEWQGRNRDFYDESKNEWSNDTGSALLVWLLLMVGIAIIGALISWLS